MGASQYPKKYWWVILVVVPVLGALIAILPALISGGKDSDGSKGGVTQVGNNNVNITGSDLSQKMYFINVQSIAKELKESGNQTLSDDLRKQIEEALAGNQSGNPEDSIRRWEKLSTEVPSPPILINLAGQYAKVGDIEKAERTLTKAIQQPASAEIRQKAIFNLELLRAARDKSSGTPAASEEVEPNNDFFTANPIQLNASVQAVAPDSADRDFFKFTTPPIYRDSIRIVLENKSTTLRPQITVYSSDKSDLGIGSYKTTPGADMEVSLFATPQTTYFVGVNPFGDYPGAYTLRVEPRKAYDSFEPNEDILNAQPIELGKKIEASILDAWDKDFYRLKAPAGAKPLKVTLHNRSTTLRPQVTAYSSRKSQIESRYETTPGADLQFDFSTTPGEDFYLGVNSFGDHPGAYSVIVE